MYFIYPFIMKSRIQSHYYTKTSLDS